jgi:hypothetical protein
MCVFDNGSEPTGTSVPRFRQEKRTVLVTWKGDYNETVA